MYNVVSLLRRGTAQRFESLLRPQLADLYRLAYRFTGSREDAEDLVQDVLTKLYPRTRELSEVENLRPWLARVLYRQFVDNLRHYSRTPFAARQQSTSGNEDDDNDPLAALHGDVPEPAADVEQLQLRWRLQRALDRLSEEHRSVLMLHDVEGFTLKELETTLDAPLGTLKSRLHRARQRLRRELDEEMEPFPSAHRVNHRGQGK